MKNDNKKEREIYAIGRPSLENLTPERKKSVLFHATYVCC